MTMRKKLLILIACLSVVLCTLVTGTVAWLMDTSVTVENVFTPSDITITLTESTDLDLKMVPGKSITKDPKVTVENDIDCYVFVKIEKSTNFDTFMTYAITDGWIQLKDENDNEIDGVFYREVASNTSAQEFPVLENDQVTVKDTVTKADMDAIDGVDENGNEVKTETQPTLTFTAYAIQKANGNNSEFTAAKAWEEIPKNP